MFDFEFDEVLVDMCGQCICCFDVCLMDVFLEFYVFDVQCCIFYWMIEY